MQCDTCHAGCCRSYNICITVTDVLRVARDLHLAPAEFTEFKAVQASDAADFERQTEAIHFSDPGAEKTRFFLTLRRVPSVVGPGSVRCIFLHEWERTRPVAERRAHPGARVIARCSIYPSRPLMCRLYPSTTDAASLLAYLRKPPTSSLSGTHPFYEVCPEDWSAPDFASDFDEVLQNHARDKYEWAFQKLAISKWNKAPGLQADFFPLMEKAYQARLVAAGDRWSEVFDKR